MYDPEQIDALIAERDRLRGEIEHAMTMLAEAEAIIGEPIVDALRAATERAIAGRPYGLAEVLDGLRGAFHKIAEDRNRWRAQAKRTRADDRKGEV